jgi:transcriptional regulator with XRE-family HTH domain
MISSIYKMTLQQQSTVSNTSTAPRMRTSIITVEVKAHAVLEHVLNKRYNGKYRRIAIQNIAERAGFTTQRLSRILRDKSQKITLIEAAGLSKALSIPIEDFFTVTLTKKRNRR